MGDQEAQSDFNSALDQYRSQYIAARNLARRTRTEYQADLRQAIDFLIDVLQLTHPSQVERRHLESFLAELDRRGLKGSSRRRKVATLRSFFGYLYQTGLIPTDPTTRLIPPEREYFQPRVLTETEYQRLQLACAHDVRDAAIIELILQTGLRLAEVASLKLADLELPARVNKDGPPGAVHVRGKGRKDRTVTLNWKALKAVKAWLAIRPEVPGDPLFVTKFKQPLGPRGIQHLVKKCLGEAEIHGASVHSLRHTFGTHMARKGVHLHVLRKVMGHESLDTTSIYVDLARAQMDKELQENAL
jgi:site-specific recombinase XerD